MVFWPWSNRSRRAAPHTFSAEPLKKASRIISGVFLIAGFMLCGNLFFSAGPATAQSKTVQLIQLDDDTINPVTAQYIIHGIERAEAEGAECLIIQMDTPGGLLTSTRAIVKRMLTADVPLVVYIAPSGSRAGSAGVFITYASHIAAMAPSTNIGAAHPVKMGGGSAPKRNSDWQELRELIQELKQTSGKDKNEPDAPAEKSSADPMEDKILNDTLSFIKSIAKERGRNAEWAAKSVAESASITNEEALEKGVVEIIAVDVNDLLKQLDGRPVQLKNRDVVLATKDASVERIAMDSRENFFNILANPNIAYFLLILGFYGLLFEVTHPGFGLPGILGAVFLILAFYSMQTLPTNYAGLALLIFGLILLVTEAYTPGFGLFAFGGVACMVLGSMLLFESADPIMRVSKTLIFTFSLTTGALVVLVLGFVLKGRRKQARSGSEGMVGERGEARQNILVGRKGQVFVHGEIWSAQALEDIKKHDEVVVEKCEGLLLFIKKK